MSRKFKLGDWVKVKGLLNSPKMQVLKYVSKKNPIFGVLYNNSYVECVWYQNGERKSDIFHQYKLVHAMDTGGLFITVPIKSKTTYSKI
ncbi:hypothetical protein [Maribacter confluentis]